jgi:hypothetical protein
MGIKQLGQAARVVQRVVHGVEQRHIAQLRTTVNVALRKDVSAYHHCFRLMRSKQLLDFMHKWLATK